MTYKEAVQRAIAAGLIHPPTPPSPLIAIEQKRHMRYASDILRSLDKAFSNRLVRLRKAGVLAGVAHLEWALDEVRKFSAAAKNGDLSTVADEPAE